MKIIMNDDNVADMENKMTTHIDRLYESQLSKYQAHFVLLRERYNDILFNNLLEHYYENFS